jgi:hypothetical protein
METRFTHKWSRYIETRRCPVCSSVRIADVTPSSYELKLRKTKIESCLNCDWKAPENGLGHCTHDAGTLPI